MKFLLVGLYVLGAKRLLLLIILAMGVAVVQRQYVPWR